MEDVGELMELPMEANCEDLRIELSSIYEKILAMQDNFHKEKIERAKLAKKMRVVHHEQAEK